MTSALSGCKVAILVADGFEQIEMTSPREALENAGAQTVLISPNPDRVRGWQFTQWGDEFEVDVPVDQAEASDYDALLLPGGLMSPDKLRRNPAVQRFVRAFFEQGKPVGSLCHGPWTLIDAGVVKGRRVTSYHTVATDLRNASAQWVDEPVVVDRGLVTSRGPDDLTAFNVKLIEAIYERRQARQRAA